MKRNFFDNHLDDDYYKNFLYGFASAQSRVRYAGPDTGSTGGRASVLRGMGGELVGVGVGGPDRSGASSAALGGVEGMGMTSIGEGLFGPEGGRPY